MIRKLIVLATAAATVIPSVANAAMLRPYIQITAGTVKLGDLFDDLGSTPDRVLGRAPAPGEHILVSAPQLAAIARDFNVDWRPTNGAEQIVLERRGDLLPRGAIADALRAALIAAGAPADSDIAMPDTQPVTVPAGSKPVPDISQCSFDPASSRFTALVSIAAPDMPPQQMRVSGSVIVLATASVLTHQLARGAEITPADVQPKRVRVGLLHGNAPILAEQAIGMVLKQNVAAGQPLTARDLERPALVLNGSVVHMTLNSEGIQLTAEGIARDSGAQGDRVRVENPNSHSVVEAQVVGPGEVRVAPRAAAVTLVSAQ